MVIIPSVGKILTVKFAESGVELAPVQLAVLICVVVSNHVPQAADL